MAQAKKGDAVKVHYTGTLDSGDVFDTSRERDPMSFTLGEGRLIPGFEQAVIGMEPGESKTVKLSADEAYGQPRAELVQKIERSNLPKDFTPEVGQHYQIPKGDGQAVVVEVIEISDESVTLDANHPLAGHDLTFEVELLEIVGG